MSERRKYLDVIISSNSEIMGGEPCFQGSRVPLLTALIRLRRGDSIETLAEEWPHVPREWLQWAERLVKAIIAADDAELEQSIRSQLVSAEPTDEFEPGD